MKRFLCLTASIVLVASLAFAHGNDQHIMGTVSKVSDSSITITTTNGTSVDVALTSQTAFTKNGKTITAQQIKQGDRVVIHAKKNGDKLEAASVQLGTRNPQAR